jgi:hypothetical protein
MGTHSSARTTMTAACSLFTCLRSRYIANAKNGTIIWLIRWLTVPLRNNHSEAMMLRDVAAASPRTNSTDGT